MKAGWKKWLLAVLFLMVSVTALQMLIQERSEASVLKADSCEQSGFRRQQLKPGLYEKILSLSEGKGNFADILTSTMLQGKFTPDTVSCENEPYLKYKREEYYLLRSRYEAVWSDLVYFPIPSQDIFFEDSFGEPREYGGKRVHEGTDLFGTTEESGYYPILSMTDGVVEKKGWLPLGGYRIGIRSPHGGYFYYAHLSDYEKEFSIGEEVKAGDILGYMGNTGYGPEGTMGQFPVHLHLGIYIKTPHHEELSVDPYWILRAVRKNIRKYRY
ncbi:MAG: M23 family metallopeptidase [Eubacteriales bacterium]|nr:M23 family metallopeptidase [Eubacteriales bacterium]